MKLAMTKEFLLKQRFQPRRLPVIFLLWSTSSLHQNQYSILMNYFKKYYITIWFMFKHISVFNISLKQSTSLMNRFTVFLSKGDYFSHFQNKNHKASQNIQINERLNLKRQNIAHLENREKKTRKQERGFCLKYHDSSVLRLDFSDGILLILDRHFR